MSNKKILLLANEYTTILNFRMELIKALVEDGHVVFVAIPANENNADIAALGCKIVDFNVSRKGTNPLQELKVVKEVEKILDAIKPDIVFTYTIKPNVYGGMACAKKKIPYVANITGLGTAIENGGIMQKVGLILYRIGLRKAQKVFFQNSENQEFMLRHHVVKGKYDLLPGSGVNLERFHLLPYPEDGDINFMYLARAMKEKGIDQYVDAAKYIKQKYSNVNFHVCGMCEQDYSEKMKEWASEGILIYHGQVKNIPEMHAISQCTIHPSYYPEGMSNVLLESAACGRPIITTNRAGCREIIDDGVNGYVVEAKNSQDLIDRIELFLSKTVEERKQMGLAGRRKVEKEFDRQIVVRKYKKEIKKL